MEKSTNTFGTSAEEVSNSQYGEPIEGGKNSKNYKVLERENIENTPFTLVTVEGNKHFLAIGDRRITENAEKKEMLLEMTEGVNWNFITNIMAIMLEKFDDFKKLENKINNN